MYHLYHIFIHSINENISKIPAPKEWVPKGQEQQTLFPLRWFFFESGDFLVAFVNGPVRPDVQREPPRRLNVS